MYGSKFFQDAVYYKYSSGLSKAIFWITVLCEGVDWFSIPVPLFLLKFILTICCLPTNKINAFSEWLEPAAAAVNSVGQPAAILMVQLKITAF